VARDAAQPSGILIVHFAVQHPMAKGRVVFGRRDARAPALGRQIAGRRHAERTEDPRVEEGIDALPGDGFDGLHERHRAEV
jgi:hypothetical protein